MGQQLHVEAPFAAGVSAGRGKDPTCERSFSGRQMTKKWGLQWAGAGV